MADIQRLAARCKSQTLFINGDESLVLLAGILKSNLKAKLKKTGNESKYTKKTFEIAEYDGFIKK